MASCLVAVVGGQLGASVFDAILLAKNFDRYQRKSENCALRP